ncbi:hypothetical protein BG015_009931 [Linnemannia schmuckeri]|uniref:Uncharacterized protein n=1 Tax=Linnemannia schmuckeri TaxID=64567 RepID=A0A9P5V979_9FUNG|nr:hypothetical protein BG015_009931 [Linnemannia schmuckeri]
MRRVLAASFDSSLHGPASIGWAICTFGYPYPRRRVGENVTVCIFRTIVIFITRLACLLGTVWYLNNLVEYLKLGDARPYNILSIENESNNGTVAPVLNIFSVYGADAVNLTSMSYHDLTGEYPLDPQVGDDPNILVLGSGVGSLDAKDGKGEYMRYVLRHSPRYASDWTRVGLIHPNSSTTVVDSRDISNQYYFYPGHIVEIRYEPLKFHNVKRQSNYTITFERFKYFLGFGGETIGYSYKSSVTHMPFPAARPATWDNFTTVLIIRPASVIASESYNEEKTSVRATMSDIGGLVGIVGSILVFLFGVSVMSPWGFISGIPYFRRRITESLAEAYTSQGGLSKGPFTTHQSNIGKFEPGMSTEMRVAMVKEQLDELELVLMEYYIDGAVFQGYDQERTKVKVRRAASIRSRMSGVDGHVQGGGGNGKNMMMEPLTLPSRMLFESQHQHKGQLPSPEHPPAVNSSSRRVSIDRHHRRTSSATEGGGVFEYYQQQKLQQYQQEQQSLRHQNYTNNSQYRNSTFSEQGLLHSLTEEPLSPSSRTNNIGRGRRSSQLNDRTHFPMDMYNDHQQDDRLGLLQQDHHSMHQTYLQNTTGNSPAYPARPPKDEIISMHLQNDSGLAFSDNNNTNAYYNNYYTAPAHSIVTATATSSPPPGYPASFSSNLHQDPVPSSLSWWKKEGITLTETVVPPRSPNDANGTTVRSRPVSVQPLNPTSTSTSFSPSPPPPSSSQQQQQEQHHGLDLSNLPKD